MNYCSASIEEKKSFTIFPSLPDFDGSTHKHTYPKDKPGIQTYLRDIRRLRRESPIRDWETDTEIEAFKQVEKGDEEIKKLIFLKFLPLVPSVVRYYADDCLRLEDLIQEGNLALMDAIDSFDYRKGYRFSSHAIWRIRRVVRRKIAFYISPFTIPSDSLAVLAKGNRLYEDGGYSSVEDAFRQSMPNRELHLYYTSQYQSLSDFSLEQQETFCDLSSLDIEECVMTKSLLEDVKIRLKRNFSYREQTIMGLIYGFEDGRSRSLSEVGKVFGISRERVRQIHTSVVNRLQNLYVEKV
ncbi:MULTISPECIES: sigma-70 family RNA polymerase sigma factor [Pontibacillus]|uniref:Sigma-70 family RNA polymerase sigma factor n=1 Tax=Pontibacillus chungwhensis TaxID=265426 RepID=A0ABY8V3C9_9BACI|nr:MULTISPECIES: sigma-70 family RNA polymerase sigma factor [Pontibacillus]MCD5324606.1 sigma-70 family RNA polymerase sigma factor [Pontibacillus sp. HN14]WIF99099.1 sigma-70 family RNA polymerase sigma factor [Pontibacillus chungwhensis]